MLDDGSTKDDVKVPDNEIGERINKLFIEESKDTSKSYRI
jgi:translation initiation factor 5A